MTIHMIGQKPNAAPSSAESAACPNGMLYTISATRIATTSVISEAQWAFMPQHAEQHEQRQQGQDREDRGQPQRIRDGVENLLVHGCLPQGRSSLDRCIAEAS